MTIRTSVVWDNHGCMPLRADASFLPQLQRYKNAGVNVVSINVGFGDMSLAQHLSILSFMRQWIFERRELYRLVSDVGDIEQCLIDGRLGIVFDVEGMAPAIEDLRAVETLYQLGVRWMLIAYNRNNAAGGGCLDADEGLTDIGRAIIDEMERVGMVLCLSHAGRRTAMEALSHARNPPIFSHSNPYGDHPHPRNVSDELMRACARKGGVIGISGIGKFLGARTEVAGRLLQQLAYVIDLVGADHVGLGLDYVFDVSELAALARTSPTLFAPDTETGAARATVEPEAMPMIAEGLARLGLGDREIGGVLGENWKRVAQTVWR